MSLTLAEAKVGMADKVDQNVIDEFRRASLLLDMLTFDDTVSPGTGGSTLTYGYVRLKTPSTVAVRSINSEYAPNEAKREEATAKVVILGGSFEVDRVIAETGGAVDEIDFQIKEKTKAGANYFHNLVINGTSAASGSGYVTGTFDGLKKLLSGSDTEYTSEADISTSALLDSNYNAYLDELDAFISKLAEKPDILLMNNELLTKTRAAARRAGFYERTTDGFGRVVEKYNGIPMMDVGQYYNGTKSVDVIETTTPSTTAYGETSVYAVKLGLNAFHGISVDGSKMVHTYLPDLSAPGAVNKGEGEMLAGAVLKSDETEFDRLSKLAEIKLNTITHMRAKQFEDAYSEDTATDFQKQVHAQIQDTFCQLLAAMSVQEASGMGTGIASVSNDGYSESYKVTTAQEKETQLMSVIRSGLSGTGLAGAL